MYEVVLRSLLFCVCFENFSKRVKEERNGVFLLGLGLKGNPVEGRLDGFVS